MVELDGHVDLREFCYLRIISAQLGQAIDPTARPSGNRVSKSAARKAAMDLLRIVADHGHTDRKQSDRAFAAGTAVFGDWAGQHRLTHTTEQTIAVLDHSLNVLRRINNAGRESLIQAVSITIGHDGRLTITEAELLRAICAALDCPLPPIMAKTTD